MRKITLSLMILLIMSCSVGWGSKEEAREASAAQEETAAETSGTSSAPEEAADAAAVQETAAEPEQPAEDTAAAGDLSDISETEIRGGTNMDDAAQLPMNTKVYGTLHDGRNMYYSFHTGPDAGSSYQITVIDKTPFDARIGFYVFDLPGSELAGASAYGDGIASTLTVDGLSPDTDYFIRLIVQNHGNSGTRNDTARFALIIREAGAQAEGVHTTNDLIHAIAPPDHAESLVVGTNQDDAALVPFDTPVSGELKDAHSGWFAFTTNSSAESTYQISVVNKSVEDLRVGFYVFDALGTEISAEYAGSDGITKTLTLNDLLPDTVYYIRLIAQNHGNSGTRTETVGYTLTIRCQDNTAEVSTASVEEAEPAVFTKPFELSSTQVRFVANQAVFIDENEAREALAPVAEIILANPDHPILLAGTTAKYGSQESCVKLSDRRAAAVRDLLVNDFGVPASQLVSVGLGYEADPFARGRDIDANGHFVESEGAKNRRVVVLSAESDIARQILGN